MEKEERSFNFENMTSWRIGNECTVDRDSQVITQNSRSWTIVGATFAGDTFILH
jgi:hypothetical protein